MKKITLILTLCLALISCKKNEMETHAAGVFETVDTLISAKTMGEILEFHVEEGQNIKEDTVVGKIDSSQLEIQKKLLKSSILTAQSQIIHIETQIAPYDEEIKRLNREIQRFTRLVKSNAANQKSLDDLNSALITANAKKQAALDSLKSQNDTIYNQIRTYNLQIEQVDDNIQKSYIKTPINGTVQTKYAKLGEFAQPGKALFKISDIKDINLRAYVTADFLTQVKIGDTAKIYADFGEKGKQEYTGKIIWISDKAEFTPKTIPTRNERSNLVYAVKIKVDNNNGLLKKGMYGEVIFENILANVQD